MKGLLIGEMRFNSQKTVGERNKTLFTALKLKVKRFIDGISINFKKLRESLLKIDGLQSKKFAGFTLTIFLISAIYVNGQLNSPEEFRVNTIHVFPEQIQTDGWQNIETLNDQNLSKDSLYQAFNTTNSAYIETSNNRVKKDLPNSNSGNAGTAIEVKEKDSEVETETESLPAEQEGSYGVDLPNIENENDPEESVTEDDISTIEDVEDEIVDPEPSVVDEDVEEDVPEPVEPEPENIEEEGTPLEAMSRGFFKFVDLATALLPFAQESIITTAEPDFEEEVSEDVVEEIPEEVAVDETEELPEETLDPVTPIEDDFIEPEVDLDDSSASTTVTDDDDSSKNDTRSDALPEDDEDAEGVDTTAEDSFSDEACAKNCESRTITLSGFGLPMIEETQDISGGQIRISFAAKEKRSANSEEQALIVKYSFDNGNNWTDGVNIMSPGESSNSINGGYYLVALPAFDKESSLDALMVQMEYLGDISDIEEIFIESAWLELFTVEQLSPDEIYDFALTEDDGYSDRILTGDELLNIDGEEILFTNTDENTDETLIIKSDNKTYSGLTKTTTYFNVTNIANSEESFSLKMHFSDSGGEVSLLEEWNQNKPRDRVVPEYKPYIYHCSAGWESLVDYTEESLVDISKSMSLNPDENKYLSETEDSDVSTTSQKVFEDPVVNIASSTIDLIDDLSAEELPHATSTPSSAPVENFVPADSVQNDTEDELEPQYICRDTNVTRTCDSLEGDNTSCRLDSVKVREHVFTNYQGGWDKKETSAGDLEIKRSLFQKAKDFVGLGMKMKDVPETFEVKEHSNDSYSIKPGETKYFKMEITFPPLSTGEFYIEAIGEDKLYGLLDPFWSSEWSYRLPITLDNTAGTEDLTEHQVYLQLDSSLSDFWSNVNTDGSDVRFVQEVAGDDNNPWYDTSWNKRTALTVDSAAVDSALSNFPVYVDLSDMGADFWSNVNTDGSDIRITESDGLTELPLEIVDIDTVGKTGELHFKAAVVDDVSDTVFYVYFGNNGAALYSATDTYGAENVWNSNYLGVYHLEEDQSGAGNAGLYQDSTSNGEDGDDEITSTGKTGKLGLGQEIRGRETDPDDYIPLPNTLLNGETNVTNSFWFNTTQTGQQGIISGGGSNEYLIFLVNTQLTLYAGGSTALFTLDSTVTDGNWHHMAVVRDDTSNQARLYLDGQPDNQNPLAITMGSLSIPANCLGIGYEQDGCGIGWNQTQQFDGYLDEFAVSDTILSAAWIESTFTNQATTTVFYSTSTVETYTSTTYTELDFYLQHFSTTTSEADVWVQVDSLPKAASTTIYMYYGNDDAVTGSDEFATFTYSTSTPTYYVVNDVASGPIEVYSYVDNNEVSIDGGTPVSLDAGETTSFATYTGTSSISSLGPIAATIDDAGTDSVAPISFATTTFAIPGNRNVNRYFIAAPFASTSVQTYIGSSGVPTDNFSLATGTVGTANADPGGANGLVVEASDPVLVVHHENSTTNRDSFVAYPPTVEDIFGIDSNNTLVSALQSNSDPTVYCSGGNTAVAAGITRGESQAMDTCTQGSEGTGDAIRYTGAASAIASIQQADSDGNESTSFWPQHEFGTTYYMTTDSAYAAIVCSPRFGTSTIEVQTNTGSTVESGTCAPSGQLPGKAYFSNGQNGDVLAFTAGYKIVSTNDVPFYVIYEDDEEDNDETNILTSIQGRKFTKSPITKVFGAQELTVDAEYEQLSYGWYENSDIETATTSWSLGEGSYATEGIPITGQGAVNPNDELRLRMNLLANAATGTATSTAFKLQYSEAETCSTATSWLDLGDIGSTTAAFSGYNNASLHDGATVASTTLASSTVFASYEEENLSSRNPLEIGVGEVAEWDWAITGSNISVNTNYCFRMIRSGGQELVTYSSYPELYTSGPPLAPTPLVYFDNERTAALDSVLEFTSTDIAGDEINYQVQIDDDLDFSSTAVDRSSATYWLEFENLNRPADKAPFDSGAIIRFTSPTTLSASTTYWWRVRGSDPDGSATNGEWSVPFSFTTDGSVTVSEWHQTTGEQFDTDTLVNLSTSTGAVSLSSSPASLTGSAIDFDDGTVGNAWGSISWSDTETSGTILYQVESLNGSSWELIPDSEIANNSTGNGTSPINILGLDTDIYNELRIIATLTGATLSIEDITVIWGQRVETPTLLDPFDNEKISDTTPTFTFTTTDPQSDDLEYEISYSTDQTFVSSTTINASSTPADFSNVTTPADTNPYNSGDTISYTVPGGSALTNGETYWWRVRAKDPDGGDAWSQWSIPDSLTVDTGVTVSTWFQTTREQFYEGTLDGLTASTSGSVVISSEIGEYGKLVVTDEDWSEVSTQSSYNNMVVVASARYTPQGETQRSVRVRNKTADTFEIKVDDPNATLSATTTVDYLVVEAGTWTIEDGSGGTQIIAGTFSDVTDVAGGGAYATSGYGEDVSFVPAFSSPPAVIATVATDNDSTWVVAHINDGNTRNNPATASAMGLYLGRSALSASHSPEDIDYVAFESGHGTNNGVDFDADVANDVHDEPPVTAEAFSSAFSAAPEVVIVMQGAEQGGNGAWFSLYDATPPTATNYYPVSDESGDRDHTPEPGSALSFEDASGFLIRDQASGGDLSGTIYGEQVLFSDGAGPKFERLLWSDTETGTSTILYRLQYLTSTSSWALIPDVDLSGNSAGTTTSPIDLTGVNVATYDTIRPFAAFQCASGNCPELHDWTVEWSEGVSVSGIAKEYDRATNVTTGTVALAINGVLHGSTGSISGGTWTINNVTAFEGDVITVFVDGAADADEAVNVFVYDGIGDMTGVALYEQHLTMSSDENATTTNALLGSFDNSVSGDEDIFFDVTPANNLEVCDSALSGCGQANIYVGSGNVFIPASSTPADIETHDFVNDGNVELDGNTLRVNGSWDNNSTLSIDTSTVIFTATSSVETIDDFSGTLAFNDIVFGETSGTATWQTDYPYDIAGDLTIDYGTFDRASSSIAIGGDLTTGASGYWSGVGTTTFDGTGTSFWSDSNTTLQNVGNVIIDGSVKTVTMTSDNRAESMLINSGGNTFDGGGANTLYLSGNFTNDGLFTAQTSTLVIDGSSVDAIIDVGVSSLYNFTASTTGGGSVSFIEANLSVLSDLTIATGTVTMPTGTTTISGSFINSGGVFAHNNASVVFAGGGTETIAQNGTTFLNAFYNLSFVGSGSYSWTDTNATTSSNFSIKGGSVTFPSGQLTIGRDFSTSGSGAFAHNNGEVVLLIQEADDITTNGSSLNDVRVRLSVLEEGYLYDSDWTFRKRVTIDSSMIDDDLTNFPVYLDLSDFDAHFFNNINSDGGDIRVTESDGMTEVAREIVSASTTAMTGEVHFNAISLSSTTDSTFYIYYGNDAASDYAITDTYGAENVWDSNYEAVYHLSETGATYFDSTGNSVDGAGEGTDPVIATGKMGEGQSITAGRIDIGTGVSSGINTAGEYVMSAWINLNTSTGDQAVFGQFDTAGDMMLWADTGGANPSFCNYMNTYMPSNCQDVASQDPGTWQHVVARYDGSNGGVYVDSVATGAGMTAGTFGIDLSKRWALGSEDGDTTARQFNGLMDEVRISSVDRGEAWISAEYANQATTTDFYTVGTGVATVRTFADTNTTALGDVTIESGTTIFPSGTFTVGGSLDNAGSFDANGGEVLFNSVAGSETLAASSSPFATLTIANTGGDLTIIENATTTAEFAIAASTNDFTLQSGTTLESTGTFTNSSGGASTTWTGSIIRLSSGSDFAINAKTDIGDAYATLLLTGDTDISMWNSTSSVYTTQDTSSIYSQDHNDVPGYLYIFGDYIRTSGTEYWSYATDFDGVDLSGGSERQAHVRVESGASVTVATSTFEILGINGASTTIDSQSGTFALNAQFATVTSEFFEATGTDINGFNLSASSTVTLFDNALFTIGTGVAAVTVDASTVDTNPASQFFGTDFVTGGGNVNVTLSGSPASYWWFRDGVRDRYGEAYDNADGDPGSIRWDDSSYTIDISGTVYSDDGTTTLGGPTCDGITNYVRIVVDGGTYTDAVPCSGINGTYTFSNVAYVGDPDIVVYLDTNGGVFGSTLTKTPTANITGLDVYANRVMTRHEDSSPMTIEDMVHYDESDDTDLRFVAATGTPDTLTVRSETELIIASSTTFTPGGNITLESGGSGAAYDGSFHIDDFAVFTASSTEAHSIGGSFFLDTGGAFTAASTTVTFTATTSGKTIDVADSGTVTFNELQFTGVGGGWNINGNVSVIDDITVATGTVTGTGDIILTGGSFVGDGLVSLGGGVTTIHKSNTLGGTQGWTFNDLVLGTGAISGTTTPASTATTTVSGALTISTGHFLDAGASVWNLAGSGTVFVEDGTLLEDSSTFKYSGVAATDILSTNYYNIILDAQAGSPTYTATGLGIQVFGDLDIGNTGTTTVNFNTNDTDLNIEGDMDIHTLGTFIASNSGSLTLAGSYNNDGVFTGSGGDITFDGVGVHTISAGNSPFSGIIIDGIGNFTVDEHATATDFTITNADDFTLGSSQSLAAGGTFINSLGGVDTVWTNSTLYLYGSGNYEINASTTNDTYATLLVGGDAKIRMWNSDAATTTVFGNGSLYSMDHSDTAGDLYIYGNYVETTRDDYWSYATDFDGTDLSGGGERQVDVYIEGTGSALWTGGSIEVLGTTTATTTVQNQGSGNYGFRIGGNSSASMSYYRIRDTDSSGLTFSGTPTVDTLSYGDILVEIDSASGITVGGGVIDSNPAKNFTQNIFATTSAISATNVTATGTSVSSWRFTNHIGNISGEAFDSDPGGDPGYVVWDDSAAIIAVSGNVYSDEGSTASGVCDGATNNVHLRVAGLTSYSTSCNGGSGYYSITGVSFSANDTLTLYIDGEAEKAANVSIDPISSISNMDLYENRVIVRHEGSNPITISDMAIWDSSDDPDIPFTAVDAGTDTLTLPADRKLLVWDSKEFEPIGNVTVSGGGAGAAYDGSVTLQDNAIWTSGAGESHSIGGSMVLETDASLDSSTATFTFTTSGSGRTIDVNENSFYNVTFNGSGGWTLTDANLSVGNDLTITSGAVVLPSGTTTVSASFDNTGGSFNSSGGLIYFTSTSAGNTIEFGGSDMATVLFDGVGGAWTIADTNATSTGTTTIENGSVVLPSGTLSIGGDFIVEDTVTHSSGNLRLYDSSGNTNLTLSLNDLHSITIDGGAAFTLTDSSAAFLGDLTINQGTFTSATGTLSIGGSFDATGGVFEHSTGTILFNSADTGETVDAGSNDFYNVQLSNASGGWTISSATTTNNFALVSANTFVLSSGESLAVNNVFTNTVGGAATTWTGSTLRLLSGSSYTINNKSAGGDIYNIMDISPDTDIRMWDSSATVTIASSSSLYSQDHAGVNGSLYIYGDYHIPTGNEYWSYANDFDGVVLGGSSRSVSVYIGANATVTVESLGTLNMVGSSGNETSIQNQGSGSYDFSVTGGTFNADRYSFDDLNFDGLTFTGSTTVITSLSNGDFTLYQNGGSSITLSSTTLDANASKIISGMNFSTTTAVSGFNITLVGTTANSWTFTGHTGVISGEDYDVDGGTDCGSLRWEDSSCMLVEQTHYRWRHDNGGEAAPNTEWYDGSWDKRQRIRFENPDSTEYTDAAIKLAVTYDSDMQADFDDLRFTDSSGTSIIPHWIERYTASTDATVWVKVPTLVSEGESIAFMYYNNVTATTTSSSTNVFTIVDDFEDGDISEYSGDTSLFNAGSSFNYGGTYGLDTSGNEGSKATDGISRSLTVSQGEIIRYMQYVDTVAGASDEVCTMFGIQSPVTDNNNYAVCIELFGTDRISLVEDVENTDSTGTVLASSTVSYSTGWYEVEIDWQTNDDIDVTLFNSSGSSVASISANDGTYTSGDIGFTYWGQNGGWDSYTSRPRLDTEPTTYFGVEQVDGGAAWSELQDVLSDTFVIGDAARLRLSVENTGLDINNINFDIEYAAKGASPTCEAVSSGDYSPVPNQTGCGASPVCMQASTFVTDGGLTTDHLTDVSGSFVSGEIVEDTSTTTGPITVLQGEYTEIEYVMTPTINASDKYCFKVTDSGTDLDSYKSVAEMVVRFDPTITSLTLNGGLDITLTGGSTTTVTATGTVTDLNGYADLDGATTTIFRSGVSSSCSADDNNCYIAGNSACSFYGCAGNSCDVTCSVDVYYHADPTDIGTYAGETWRAELEVSDISDAVATATAPSIDLLTLRAISIADNINYGSLTVNDDTGSYNATTTVENIGNDAIDVSIEGTDLTDGGSSAIPVSEQIFATSTFNYSSCVFCSSLATTSTNYELDLNKPTSTVPSITDDVFWGIAIPFGAAGTPHQGVNTFYATAD